MLCDSRCSLCRRTKLDRSVLLEAADGYYKASSLLVYLRPVVTWVWMDTQEEMDKQRLYIDEATSYVSNGMHLLLHVISLSASIDRAS